MFRLTCMNQLLCPGRSVEWVVWVTSIPGQTAEWYSLLQIKRLQNPNAVKKLNTEQTIGLSLNPSSPADAMHSVFAFSASLIWKCVKMQLNATADCLLQCKCYFRVSCTLHTLLFCRWKMQASEVVWWLGEMRGCSSVLMPRLALLHNYLKIV